MYKGGNSSTVVLNCPDGYSVYHELDPGHHSGPLLLHAINFLLMRPKLNQNLLGLLQNEMRGLSEVPTSTHSKI